MYDLKKRAYFSTLGELRMLLEEYPDEMPVYNCGSPDSWLHIDADEKYISLDNESLYYDYAYELESQGIADSEDMEEYYEFQQRKDHEERLEIAYYALLAQKQEMIPDYLDF